MCQPRIFSVVKRTDQNAAVLMVILACGANLLAGDKYQNAPLYLAVSVPASQLLHQHRSAQHVINAVSQSSLATVHLHEHLDVALSSLLRGADTGSIARDSRWLSLCHSLYYTLVDQV